MIKEDDNGQIIVTELRPMNQLAVINDCFLFVLGYKESKRDFVRIRLLAPNNEVYCAETGKLHSFDQFLGWIPPPIYQPKKNLGTDRANEPPCRECGATNARDAQVCNLMKINDES